MKPPPPCTLQRISDHVWWFTPESQRDRPALGAIAGRAGTVMVDAGASPAHAQAFLAALADARIPAPRTVVLTHAHWDHVFGLAALDTRVIATVETDRRLAAMMTWDYSEAGLPGLLAAGHEIPFTAEYLRRELADAERRSLRLRRADVTLTDRHRIELDDVTCEILAVGGDHAPDACVIHVPDEGVLFLGDCLCEDIYREPRRYTRAQVLPLLARIEALAAPILIEGHAEMATPPAEFARLAAALRDAYAWLEAHPAGTTADPLALRAALASRHAAADLDALLPLVLAGLGGAEAGGARGTATLDAQRSAPSA